MSTHEQQTSTIPTSVVRNTRGKSGPQNLEEPASNEALRELCDKNYHQLLPLIAEKMQKEKEQQDKLKAVKARLLYGNESGRNPRNHEESHYSESKTPTARTEPRRRHGRKHSRSPSPASSEDSSKTDLLHLGSGRGRREVCSIDWEEKNQARIHALIVTTRVPKQREPRYRQESIIMRAHRPEEPADIRRAKTAKGVTGSPNQKGIGQMSNTYEDDLSQPWTCEERNPFTPRIRHFNFPRTRMPNHVKTYDGREDPVEIHHIKQRDGESTEDFMEIYKADILDVEGAPECMKISGFMHGITHPELIKRLYEKIPRSMNEMYRVTTSFLQGEVAAFSHGRKKASTPWKQPEGGSKPSFKKGFKNKHRSDRTPDRFSLLTKTPKEIFALEKGKFKAPPPMVTPAEKRDPNKYCEFHADTGHSTDKCMQLRKQIDEMIKAGKLSQFIKELKQNDKPKAPKKGDTTGKERQLAILMIQPWEKVAKQKVTQSFSPETTISFPPLGDEDGTKGPMIIEAEIGGLRPEIRSQMVPPTTYLTGFSGETIWPLGQISLLVKIGDEGHSTSAWMNFMVVRSPSQYNGIIGRPGIRKIRAIPSTAHGMLKFLVEGGIVTLRSSRIIPMECTMIFGPSTRPLEAGKILEEKNKSDHSSGIP
ncbi:hypothetical protein Tco_1277592 [Tanacetum coccineum]